MMASPSGVQGDWNTWTPWGFFVTENGIATADDTRRQAFIRTALEGVQRCVADGIPVKGYFHWSLLDSR